MRLKACHCCGLVQQIPDLTAGQQARCNRCSSVVDRPGRNGRQSAARCLAASTGALILYFPAILLPILRIEKLGHHSEAGLLSGTFDLLQHGNWFVGTVVLLFSIVLPLVKLTALFELSWVSLVGRKHKAWTYRLVETAGRWSMMDVLLLALLVTVVKLGDLVEFSFGPAVIAFSLCVFMSLIASAVFDPHAIWEESDVK
ncbi:MAG: paraquat-inducible protein A [Pirellulales bacterium]